MQRINKCFGVALVALAVAPAAALAAAPGAAAASVAPRPAAVAWPRHAQFDWTYPYASRLCAETASGRPPSRLTASSAQVAQACTQLQTSFASAKTAYLTAVTPLSAQALGTIRQYVQLCRQDRLNHDAKACRPARQAAITTLDALRAEVRAATQTYRRAVNRARQAFWATIRSLRGGATVKADSASASTPPSPILPPNSSVPAS